MAYYFTHSISQFLLNNKKQRVRFLLAHAVYYGYSGICIADVAEFQHYSLSDN